MRPSNVVGDYAFKCTSCGRTGRLHYPLGARLRVGDVVPEDPANPAFARCPRCSRYALGITAAPPEPAPPRPVGFTRVPTE